MHLPFEFVTDFLCLLSRLVKESSFCILSDIRYPTHLEQTDMYV